eukprot:COSAG02_NODE_67621_length_252_cov_1.013072_1_plen_83_part_11
MGGVTFDGEDVAAFLSSIASGLPGKYVLRVVGAGGEVIISALDIHPYQDGKDYAQLFICWLDPHAHLHFCDVAFRPTKTARVS